MVPRCLLDNLRETNTHSLTLLGSGEKDEVEKEKMMKDSLGLIKHWVFSGHFFFADKTV